MQVEVPERTIAQRMEALERANRIRYARAQFKRDVRTGDESVVGALMADECPWHLETAKVFDLLLSTPKIGRVKAKKILDDCRISPSKTVGGLTARQRAELASKLMPWDVAA